MRALTGVLVILFLIAAAGAALAPPPGAGEGQQGPKICVVPPAMPNEAFQKTVNGNVTVMYMEGWKDVAEKMAGVVSKSLSDMMGKAGLEYTGTCEVTLRPLQPELMAQAVSAPIYDAPNNTLRYPIGVPQDGAQAFSFDDLKTKTAIISLLNGAAGMQLQASQPDAAVNTPRWFIHGLTLYLLGEMAKETAGDNWEQLVSQQLTDKMLEHYKDTLLDWTSKKESKFDQIYSMASARIFVEVHKKFGAEAVKKIGAEYAKAQKVDKDSLVKIFTDAIGEDFIAFLKGYVCPIRYPMLGVVMDPQFAEGGVKVNEVQPGSSAAEAGVAPGDIIIKAAGKGIKDLSELKAAIDEVGVGGKLDLVVKRGGEEVELSGTLKDRTFEFPPPPPSEQDAEPGQKAEPEEKAEPEQKPEGQQMSEEERRNKLASVGFNKAQIEMLLKYFERADAAEAAKMDEETKARITAFLLKAGFLESQITMLVSIFRIDPDSAKSLPAVAESEEYEDDGRSALEMLVEEGFDRALAEQMIEMYKKMGKTEKDIKKMIASGQVRMGPPDPNEDKKSALELLVARGFDRALAEQMIEMYKKMGKTEEEIKEMILKGKMKMKH